jgi:hypothetical protein
MPLSEATRRFRAPICILYTSSVLIAGHRARKPAPSQQGEVREAQRALQSVAKTYRGLVGFISADPSDAAALAAFANAATPSQHEGNEGGGDADGAAAQGPVVIVGLLDNRDGSSTREVEVLGWSAGCTRGIGENEQVCTGSGLGRAELEGKVRSRLGALYREARPTRVDLSGVKHELRERIFDEIAGG